jgi:hypothetical protein
MVGEVGRRLERVGRIAGEGRRAHRKALARHQRLGRGTVTSGSDEPDADIQLVTIQVRLVVAGHDPHLDVGTRSVEPG